jgi:preprotein translocase SecE subunit
VKVGIPVLVCVAVAALVYWLVGVNRGSADFLIATDGEMKKVNWTSRREIISATKVVIVVTLLMGFILFGVDYAFMQFFRWIGVLRTGGGGE